MHGVDAAGLGTDPEGAGGDPDEGRSPAEIEPRLAAVRGGPVDWDPVM